MSLFNIGLVLLSSLMHSFWNILTQTSKNSQYFSALKGICIMVMALIAYLWFGMAPLNSEIIFWGILSGILHGVYILCLSRAYSTADISYVYPIARSAPVFVPVFAWLLLDEHLHISTFLAIGFILTAIYILHFEGKLLRGFVNLIRAFHHQDLRWAFYTLAMVVSYSLVDKKGMDSFLDHLPDQPFANGVTFFFIEAVIGFVICNLYIFFTNPAKHVFLTWRAEWHKAILAGVATLGSYGLICVVLQFEALSAIVSLRQVSVLMVVYWGCWKLKEPFGPQRLLAGGMILVGIFLIGANSH
ncbi:MAG: EamA family transporter [Nitrospinae bacterium]|nr:EamA family transporter [Nitrospinota bacterium]